MSGTLESFRNMPVITCKEVTRQISELPKPTTVEAWAKVATARAMLANSRHYSVHEFKFVRTTPYLYKHVCVHCNRKKDWWMV